MSGTYTIKKVAQAGATGNLGPTMLRELVKAGFDVTVLYRAGGKPAKLEHDVKQVPVDYSSLDSLTSALQGQDALISTIGSASFDAQSLMIEAAAKAGVKRFLPSEFGSDTSNANLAKLAHTKDKALIHGVLKKTAETSDLTYTLVNNGPFFDWGLMVGWMMSVPNKSITIYDGGKEIWSTSTLADASKAAVGVLRNPEATKNRVVYVQSRAMTQLELLAMGQKATGGPEGWTVNEGTTTAELAEADEEFQKPKPDHFSAVMKLVRVSVYREGYGADFSSHLDNDLLGIKEMTDAETQALVDSFLPKK